MDRRPELSLHEWVVLALVAEAPRHGYDVAAEAAPTGPLGAVWTVPRPAVYRALARLEDLGHVRARRTETGAGAPPRTVYGASRTGRAALRRWLAEPVEHLRDVRSTLLVKLVLGPRLGVAPGELVRAQRRRFAPLVARRSGDGPSTDPVELWRRHAALAVDAFLADLGG